MKKTKKRALIVMSALLVLLLSVTVFGADTEYVPELYGTFWALVPPIVAIVLALITKEVYSSLFIGIVIGGIFFAGGSFEKTINHVLSDGIIASLSDAYNVGILVFLVVLGAIVALMNTAGGSAAFGEWAAKHIKTKVGAQLATILLGCLIFVDDYFNCLTVGSVMRPVTDKHKISRAKLAYLIDATAAPVCIIAPISSWAAAVTGFVKDEDGFALFIKSIPYNYYALLTIVMMVTIVLLKVDFGSMAKHEENAAKGDLFSTGEKLRDTVIEKDDNKKGKVCDLVVPVVVLIICCVTGMIYTGGFFRGVNFVEAFSGSDAAVGLSLGSIFALIITVAFYMGRRVLSFRKCMDCIPEGFKAMVPAILILTFAWTLKAMTDSLGAAEYVSEIMKGCAGSLQLFLPAIIFLVACGLAFATGTSWGTFGILIPIVVSVFQKTDPTLMIISISACMAGAVCGDHCSPISDTTIMSSAGAQCEHTNHVSTQIPYAVMVAAVSFVTYIIAATLQKAAGIGWVALPIGILLMVGVIVGIKALLSTKQAKEN